MDNRLERYSSTWNRKKILREVYTGWYKRIIEDLNPGEGKTVELGSGIGNFKKFKPDVVASDISHAESLDMRFDAHFMPFARSSISNIVMIDVLHHLANPIQFIKEAIRILEKGGRILILEPYPSPFSLIIYRLFHPEPVIMNVDYFTQNSIKKKDPWEANQAVAYLLFFKHKKKFLELFNGDLFFVKKKLLSCVLYPISGGFENKALIPDFMIPVFKVMEILLIPLRFLLAFRCYMVLEKI